MIWSNSSWPDHGTFVRLGRPMRRAKSGTGPNRRGAGLGSMLVVGSGSSINSPKAISGFRVAHRWTRPLVLARALHSTISLSRSIAKSMEIGGPGPRRHRAADGTWSHDHPGCVAALLDDVGARQRRPRVAGQDAVMLRPQPAGTSMGPIRGGRSRARGRTGAVQNSVACPSRLVRGRLASAGARGGGGGGLTGVEGGNGWFSRCDGQRFWMGYETF